jgi:pimeloyl-ACP methyl ester carboxylesterase
MRSAFLTYRSSRVHYLTGGEGRQLLLCLHGYGESAAAFSFLESALRHDFTILAIDLPFHGQTDWKEGLFFDPEELLAMLRQITDSMPEINERWFMLGYSMGGRVALSLMEKVPEIIENLVLAAPDGLKWNAWYWLVTRTWAGNLVFQWTMQRPGWLFLLLNAADKLRLIDRGLYKFTTGYINTATDRDQLYKCWTIMRRFRPDPATIKSLICQSRVRVGLIYGRHDLITRAATGEKFCKKITPYGRLTLLDAGHRLLQDKYLDAFIALLKD